ncbi:amidohydrolase [Streptomyces sp. AV19]|uniref:amidohydrolase n=1 Tax=Streptomyces sp. AV19 TaxID=2793068 RepID=UPI0018FE4816|nr:amidohydrolase [Streptomyces sp. AV19]MBH1937889.1 amidohydrolase [Streptomyces sp. AV19]MDG4536512.1 amidohydrolase [Streptomyces sp. AV19]
MADAITQVLAGLDEARRRELAALYRDLHAHPELSFAEHRTAAEVARKVRSYGYDVTESVGRTGVVAVLKRGAGPTVLLRADFDAVPVPERTGLPHASAVDGVMHACGHDMHTTCLVGALRLLAEGREHWSGTVVAVFQPAQETGEGAKAMVEDGLFKRFGRPKAVLGQRMAALPAGTVGCHPGPAFAAADSLRVRLTGRGGHASVPEATVDPVVMAAAAVLRLQTVVSREVAGRDTAIVTVGSLRAGADDGLIPDEAELRLDVRTYDRRVRKRVLAAIERILRAEAGASGADRPPEITPLDSCPVLVNDPDAADRTMTAVGSVLGLDNVTDPGPLPAGDDLGILGTAARAPVCHWLLGGCDPEAYARAEKAGTTARDVPAPHTPYFAPVVEPTLSTGVTALVAGALAWLGGHPRGRR